VCVENLWLYVQVLAWRLAFECLVEQQILLKPWQMYALWVFWEVFEARLRISCSGVFCIFSWVGSDEDLSSL
jgi:hypothetical protein